MDDATKLLRTIEVTTPERADRDDSAYLATLDASARLDLVEAIRWSMVPADARRLVRVLEVLERS